MLLVLLELVCYSQYLVAIHFYSSPCFYLPTENLNILSFSRSGITAQDKDVQNWKPSLDHLVLGISIKPLFYCHNCKLLVVVAVSKHLVAYIWGSKNGDNRSIVTYKASTDIADDPPIKWTASVRGGPSLTMKNKIFCSSIKKELFWVIQIKWFRTRNFSQSECDFGLSNENGP